MKRHLFAVLAVAVAGPAFASGSSAPADRGSGDRATTDRAMSQVVVEAGSEAPRLISTGDADYPVLARRLGVEGEAQLRMRVGVDGRPYDIALVRGTGHPALDLAAIRDAKQWRFVPARVNGEYASTWASMPVSYVLDDGDARPAATLVATR